MIEITNKINQKPYKLLYDYYYKAIEYSQESIDAICISSFDNLKKEVDSRYVNLKFIIGNKFIFFTNYDSPKSFQFKSHAQVAVVIFWPKINTQIRIKAHIDKADFDFSNDYFKHRSDKKNALAICSRQSKPTRSFNELRKNYDSVLNSADLSKRPSYWGGFELTPYYFEFWQGDDNRLNKRVSYSQNSGSWEELNLQP